MREDDACKTQVVAGIAASARALGFAVITR